MNFVFKFTAAVTAALAGLLLLQSCAHGADDSDGLPTDASPLVVNHCAACHGPEGLGTEVGPQMVDPVPEYARFVTRAGRDDMGFDAPMAAFGTGDLSDSAMEDVLTYLKSRPRVTTGQDLYLRYCGNCHGADASGGRSEKALPEETDEADEWLAAVRKGKGSDMAIRKKYMPAWTADGLTDSEVEAIRGYVATLASSTSSSSAATSSSTGSGLPDDDDDDDDD